MPQGRVVACLREYATVWGLINLHKFTADPPPPSRRLLTEFSFLNGPSSSVSPTPPHRSGPGVARRGRHKPLPIKEFGRHRPAPMGDAVGEARGSGGLIRSSGFFPRPSRSSGCLLAVGHASSVPLLSGVPPSPSITTAGTLEACLGASTDLGELRGPSPWDRRPACLPCRDRRAACPTGLGTELPSFVDAPSVPYAKTRHAGGVPYAKARPPHSVTVRIFS